MKQHGPHFYKKWQIWDMSVGRQCHHLVNRAKFAPSAMVIISTVMVQFHGSVLFSVTNFMVWVYHGSSMGNWELSTFERGREENS